MWQDDLVKYEVLFVLFSPSLENRQGFWSAEDRGILMSRPICLLSKSKVNLDRRGYGLEGLGWGRIWGRIRQNSGGDCRSAFWAAGSKGPKASTGVVVVVACRDRTKPGALTSESPCAKKWQRTMRLRFLPAGSSRIAVSLL